jgi:hypothetical protein
MSLRCGLAELGLRIKDESNKHTKDRETFSGSSPSQNEFIPVRYALTSKLPNRRSNGPFTHCLSAGRAD